MTSGLSYHDVRTFWLQPALKILRASPLGVHYDCASENVLRLLGGTGFLETRYQALQQYGGGPALGFWQMEPATFSDNLAWLKRAAPDVAEQIQDASDMAEQPVTGALMCRVHYMRKPFSFPAGLITRSAIAGIHKQFYNTALGAADPTKNTEILKGFIT